MVFELSARAEVGLTPCCGVTFRNMGRRAALTAIWCAIRAAISLAPAVRGKSRRQLATSHPFARGRRCTQGKAGERAAGRRSVERLERRVARPGRHTRADQVQDVFVVAPTANEAHLDTQALTPNVSLRHMASQKEARVFSSPRLRSVRPDFPS